LESRKKEVFDYLLNEDPNQNILSLSIKKMSGLNKQFLEPFAQKLRSSEKYSKDPEVMGNLEKIEYLLDNISNLFYEALPEKSLFALNHNDCHPRNILVTGEFEKIFLIDHEYAAYNLIGCDVANYNIENLFYLGKDDWPFYDLYENDFHVLENELYFTRFTNYIDRFASERKEFYKDVEGFDEFIEYFKSKDYYWRCICFSGLLWFVWGINYFDFDEWDNHRSFNYFNFILDRLKGYFIAKELVLNKEINNCI